MQVKEYPKIMIIHLKRFRVDPATYRHHKVSTRVPFSTTLTLGPQLKYTLKGIVVHMGQGLSYGHYYSIVKCQDKWLRFDDSEIKVVDEAYLKAFFGSPTCPEHESSWPCAYMMFYENEELSITGKKDRPRTAQPRSNHSGLLGQ